LKSAAIDIGNTRIKVGFFLEDKLQKQSRYATLEEVMSVLSDLEMPVIISSVVVSEEDLSEIFKDFSTKIILNSKTPLPVSNRYGTPETLGYDRLAAVIGANGRFPNQNCLVIDIGTAIKYDFVSDENAFIGGIIAPGREMRFKALHTFTKKLPLLNATDIPALIGTSTETCIESGVLNGIVAEINGMIESYVESYNPVVLLCGGDAPYFETQIKYPTFATPNLVLEGLNRILLYNVAKA
jgi:type III pantothenate kinase